MSGVCRILFFSLSAGAEHFIYYYEIIIIIKSNKEKTKMNKDERMSRKDAEYLGMKIMTRYQDEHC